MDFNLPAEAEELRRSARAVVDTLLKHEPEFHATNRVPDIVDETLCRLGYYGLAIPEEYGGLDCDLLTSAAIQLELARMPPQFWPLIRSAVGPTPHAIIRHGTKAQKNEWLPQIATGAKRVCFALTEPGGGSDVVAMKTTAVRKGDRYILNGTKTFISNANKADVIAVFAYTDRSKGRDGISALLVTPGTKGFHISKPMKTMGWMVDGLFELSFQDCEVPVENLLGEEGKGFYYALEGLSEARLNVGCQAIGGGDIAYEATLNYAKERKTFGASLASHQAVQHMLADMMIDQHAARQVLFEAFWRAERGEDVRLKSAIVKVFCTEAANRTADRALQIHGGAGYISGMIVERVYRDLRVLRIYEGASEIQRNMIAKQLLR
ncbi:MAG: acyl-CoA dehydrogenase family protein [Rhizobiales bacterium]|nr:acyl-CoA dehydrogenase family protein [Hyphomicrobiales bacterium]